MAHPASSWPRLLRSGRPLHAFLAKLAHLSGGPLQILDENGAVLIGPAQLPGESAIPLEFDGKLLGRVAGPATPAVKPLLEHLIAVELEKRALAEEVLARYRELNLLYQLSDRLNCGLEPEQVASAVLKEARRLIASAGGAVLRIDRAAQVMRAVARVAFHPRVLPLGQGIVGTVAAVGSAEVVNNTAGDTRSTPDERAFGSLLCASLPGRDGLIAVICLTGGQAAFATAGDLKLLTSLAVQASLTLENAFTYEQALKQAAEREEDLRQQMEALRIELDERRQTERVAAVTETDGFRRLRGEAEALRSIIRDEDE